MCQCTICLTFGIVLHCLRTKLCSSSFAFLFPALKAPRPKIIITFFCIFHWHSFVLLCAYLAEWGFFEKKKQIFIDMHNIYFVCKSFCIHLYVVVHIFNLYISLLVVDSLLRSVPAIETEKLIIKRMFRSVSLYTPSIGWVGIIIVPNIYLRIAHNKTTTTTTASKTSKHYIIYEPWHATANDILTL